MSRGDAATKRAPTIREWILETVHVLEHVRDELFPATGGLGRDARREILWIHTIRGRHLLELDELAAAELETNAADALREAVAWLEELEAEIEELRSSGVSIPPKIVDALRSPRWFNWALRLLPSVGLSRYGRLARKAAEVNV